MKTALYGGHHDLPFWGNGQQPNIMFDPVTMSGWKYDTRDEGQIELHEGWMWPILVGLSLIEFPLLAHVSAGFIDGKIVPIKRMWVQITTLPTEEDENGFPLVVKPFSQGKNVEHLWGGDNGTYSPWGFEDVKSVSDEDKLKPEFWKFYFERKLLDQRDEAIQKSEKAAAEARRLIELYSVVKL